MEVLHALPSLCRYTDPSHLQHAHVPSRTNDCILLAYHPPNSYCPWYHPIRVNLHHSASPMARLEQSRVGTRIVRGGRTRAFDIVLHLSTRITPVPVRYQGEVASQRDFQAEEAKEIVKRLCHVHELRLGYQYCLRERCFHHGVIDVLCMSFIVLRKMLYRYPNEAV